MKILIVTKNWLGDILFEFPTLEAIRRKYPEAEMVCLAPSRCFEILQNHPAVNRVILFDERSEHRSFLSKLKLVLELRREKWDQAYLFHRSRTRSLLMILAGVKERIGFEHKGRRVLLTRSVPEPPPTMHQVDHFIELLRGLGIPAPSDPRYRFYFKENDRVAAEKILQGHGLDKQKYVCFHLGANWEPKRWPPASFAKLADLLAERAGIPVLVTGADRDKPLVDEMFREVKKARVISLVGRTGLGELGALFEKSLFLVSGDSGPLHIASGVGTPVVALFGPTHPKFTGPRGVGEVLLIGYVPPGYESPWYGEGLPKEGWMSRILPEDVFSAVEKKGWLHQLAGRPAHSRS